jgi:uncharacterized membrane protein
MKKMSQINLNKIKTHLTIVILIAESISVKKLRNNKIHRIQVLLRNLAHQIHWAISNIHQMKILKTKEFLRLRKTRI